MLTRLVAPDRGCSASLQGEERYAVCYSGCLTCVFIRTSLLNLRCDGATDQMRLITTATSLAFQGVARQRRSIFGTGGRSYDEAGRSSSFSHGRRAAYPGP